ncbi:etoposide-induced protein 2.4-domain-containing protein [Amylostereum chailletii]|nr:etoposide-induced protein 2.4-domain-containing protein [Amylostereum chailletii]
MSRPIFRAEPSSYQRAAHTSARTSYPTFLTLQDTLTLQIGWAWRGLVDASRWDVVLRVVTSDPEIRTNAVKSFMLNAISLFSIYVFDLLLHPLAKDQPQSWLHRNVGWFYQVLWLLPVVGASLYLNTSWCNLIAQRTYTLQHGRSSSYTPVDSGSKNSYIVFLNSIATSAYRGVMISTSVALSFALGYVPLVGGVAEITFFAWVDAYYCFEFIWIARGMSLSRRVRHLEERWMYYLAFGLPSATLCMWGSALANAALFAILFPSYIIMAMHARPVPHDPYNPLPPSDSHQTVLHPSPYIPIRIPIFTPVIVINDAVLRVLNFCMRSGHNRAGSGMKKERDWRGVEMEEGAEAIEMRPSASKRGSGGPMLRQGGVRLASRRKFD